MSTAEGLLGLVLWSAAVATRPWRMLQGPLLTPTLAALALLPWGWMLPQWLPPALPLTWSGACLLALSLGWPLSVLVLSGVALQVWAFGGWEAEAVFTLWLWLGVLPATLTMLLGAAMRRWLPDHVFIYILGRGFLGTVLCMFVAGWLHEVAYHSLGNIGMHDAVLARWLMAWGDGFMTGGAVAIAVAFFPQWLATWSDQRYLRHPSAH